jgi:hypothetical protein
MSSDAHDSLSRAILAVFVGLEEEVNPSLGPPHAPVTLTQGPWAPKKDSEFIQHRVERVQLGLSSAHLLTPSR